MRLDRILAQSGLGSRREVTRLIHQGRVELDGRTLTRPETQLDAEEAERLLLDGALLDVRRYLTLLFHKPLEVVTALVDARHASVGDWLGAELIQRGVVPVGRLDRMTSGLLILSNDGQLVHRLCAPRWGIEKCYEIRHEGPALTEREEAQCAAGIALDDGPSLPARLERLEAGHARLTVTEGRQHIVRRIFAALVRPVVELARLSHGPVDLTDLEEPGSLRPATDSEEAALYAACALERPGPLGHPR